MHYDPQYHVAGYDYYEIGRLLRILHERCDREDIKDLCENALLRQPRGLELRNEYLLPIREGLQEWKEGVTISMMVKLILTRVLDDSVEGGVYDYNRLSLSTVVAFDPHKELKLSMQK